MRQSNARSVGRPPQRAKLLIVRKRHRGGMPAREGWQGGADLRWGGFAEGEVRPHKWGVPLSLHDVILNRSPLFFWQKRRKRKANKRKTPQENFALCGGRPTLRALDGRSLFEKATENKSVCSREVPDKSKFEFTVKQKALCNTQRFVFIIPTRTSRRIPLAQYRIP